MIVVARSGRRLCCGLASTLLPCVLLLASLPAGHMASCWAAEKRPFVEAAHQGGELRYIEGIPVLIVQGTPEQVMGTNCRRYAILEQATERPTFDLADVAKLMHAVNQGEDTIQSMVFEPVPLRLHVGLGQGPVTARPLKAIELTPLMETSMKERIAKPRKDEDAKGR